jgi:hypothetical protein
MKKKTIQKLVLGKQTIHHFGTRQLSGGSGNVCIPVETETIPWMSCIKACISELCIPYTLFDC